MTAMLQPHIPQMTDEEYENLKKAVKNFNAARRDLEKAEICLKPPGKFYVPETRRDEVNVIYYDGDPCTVAELELGGVRVVSWHDDQAILLSPSRWAQVPHSEYKGQIVRRVVCDKCNEIATLLPDGKHSWCNKCELLYGEVELERRPS